MSLPFRDLPGVHRLRRPALRAEEHAYLVWFALLVTIVACAPPAATAPAAPVVAPQVARGVLRAGTSGEYPPISVWKDERVEGFAPALVTAFATSTRQEVRWTRFTWPGLADDLRADRFELAADGITVRTERSIAGRFTVPIARGGAVLLLRRPAWVEGTPTVATIDRPRLHVLVNQGGHLERVAHGLFHAAEIRAIADNDAVRAAFARGEADAALTNTFEAPRWANGVAGVEQLGPLTEDVTAIWVRADHAALADQLDEWLIDEEESGRLAALRTRWVGPGAGPRAALPVSALLAATAERLALMPLVAAAKQRTGKAVEDTAQEANVIAASTSAVDRSAALHGRPPPSHAAVESFFRAQIESAKVIQRKIAPPTSAPLYRLDEDLRPAIARISARMAFLIVRMPYDVDAAEVAAEAHRELATSGLEPADIDGVASALAALGHP